MANNIRNFCIIAHVDHGKSTLADRFLELTGTVSPHKMKAQYLDQMELERERGITIKMAPVRMIYHPHRRITQKETQNNAEISELLYQDLTYKIRGAIFEVRKNLGLGHKESVYHQALIHEFSKRGISFESEKSVHIFYDNKKVGSYQPDFIVDGKVLIELKSLPEIGRPQVEQLWSYLKGSDYKLALLINFGSKNLEIRRVVYESARLPRPSASSLRKSAQVEEYVLNLIDTPGHSDFSYEVSRALKAVEGAILLVDATQGIQAQTLANLEMARANGLKIIGAVNKIDMNPTGVPELIKELADLISVKPEEIYRVSGKTGEGVPELLQGVIDKIPPPTFVDHRSALIFSSLYDDHKGIISFVRIFGGEFKAGEGEKLLSTGHNFKIKEVGYFYPEFRPEKVLTSGDIGYIATGIKDPDALKIGDTIGEKLLPGFRIPKPVIFVALYPGESDNYDNLKTALYKLRLNDSSISIAYDTSEVLGRGFQCGFLGRLHFEIVVQRLERDFNLEILNSFPSVAYQVKVKGENYITIERPKDFPSEYEEVLEPMTKIRILTPLKYLGVALGLKESFRLNDITTESQGNNVLIFAKLPLADLIFDFDDRLKSVSQGFASFSYEIIGFEKTRVKRLDIFVAGEQVPGLSRIVYENDLAYEARRMVEKLKDLLPRQQFAQALQGVEGGRIIARETIPAIKKDVTGYLYGGDRTRKMKLWKKQKAGKIKLKERGRVNIPVEIFKELLKR